MSKSLRAKVLSPVVSLICLMCGIQPLSASVKSEAVGTIDSLVVYFDINSAKLSADSVSLMKFAATADSLYLGGKLSVVEIEGSSSPEGKNDANIRLALKRAEAVEAFLRRHTAVPPEMIATTSHGSNWKLFLRQAEEDSNGAVCENTISAIRDTDRHAARVKLLRSLKPSDWNRVKKLLLPLTRFALVRAVGLPGAPSVAEAPVEAPVADTITVAEEVVEVPDTVSSAVPAIDPVTYTDSCLRRWSVSTNTVGLAMAIVNATAHYQWNCRWSAALSLYYSAWDYGRSDCKFRTFIFRPEVRYWTRRAGSGLFFDAHVAMAAYNFALPSWDYRIQDVDGTHPALGGGLGIGWRQNLSRRWALEFQAGAGVYALRYDRFENRPCGPLYDSRKRVFFGLDNFAISVVYNFNPRKSLK